MLPLVARLHLGRVAVSLQLSRCHDGAILSEGQASCATSSANASAQRSVSGSVIHIIRAMRISFESVLKEAAREVFDCESGETALKYLPSWTHVWQAERETDGSV